MSFGGVLRDLRNERGLSLSELAELSHFSKGYLSNLETGRKPASQELASQLEAVLEAPGVLVEAARQEAVTRADATPWQTAELLDRLQSADVSARTLESLHSAVTELCCQYSWRDAAELRNEAHGWIEHISNLLRRPVGVRAHMELLTAAGWLALLTGCVEYDMGLKSSAEFTRTSAQQIGLEAGHLEIVGWSYEMAAWFALTQERYPDVVKNAQAGQAMTRGTSVHVQLIAQEAKAKASLGESNLPKLLEHGRQFLDHLPPPDRPDNHFKIDPKKLDFYEMDTFRLSGDDARAKQYAEIVIGGHPVPDGVGSFPMRVTQARLALALIASREGDLESAVGQAMTAIGTGRRSLPSFKLLCRELSAEIVQRYPGELLSSEFADVVRGL